MKKPHFFILFTLVFFCSCALKKNYKVLSQINTGLNSSNFSNYQTGFCLYDLSERKLIFEKNANKFFIPASNTKLLTFYAGLCTLPDSLPSIKYIINNDSLIIWPQADPSFLHPNYPNQIAFNFIKNSNKQIYLVTDTYKGQKFGYGWPWDDFNDYYATQVNDLPMYGNMLNLNLINHKVKMQPDLLAMFLSDTCTTATANNFAQREIYNNNITLPQSPQIGFKQQIPLYLDTKIQSVLLSDTLLATGQVTKEIKSLPFREIPKTAKTIYTSPTDSLYKHMLQSSDNFMAEQLLLSIAYKNNLETKQATIIEHIKSNFLMALPDTLQWLDGSGLSRMNLNTPRNLTKLLEAIYVKAGEKRSFELLSAGGVNGTLKNYFKSSPPFVFAKTGTVSNNFCLSGFIIGNSGKRYAFSFMNNSYMLPSKKVKAQVEAFITLLKPDL